MSLNKNKGRRNARVAEATARKAARDERTPQQQLQRLDALLGVSIGAKKERKRLNKQIQK